MNLTKHGVDLDGATALFNSGFEDSVKYNYPLTESDVVLDIGGYDATWTMELIKWHGFTPKVHIFEPVYYTMTEYVVANYLGGHPNIQVYRYGLSDKDETCSFNINEHSTGKYQEPTSTKTQVVLQDIVRVIDQLDIAEVDLMSLNIEGGEFSVLPRLIDSGAIKKVKCLLVQFHAKVPNAIELREQINARLRETHNQIHDYPFVWDAWGRK